MRLIRIPVASCCCILQLTSGQSSYKSKVEIHFQLSHPAVISDDLSIDGDIRPCYHLSGRTLQPTLNIAIQGCPAMLFHPAEPSSS